jgi:hypothetical protein
LLLSRFGFSSAFGVLEGVPGVGDPLGLGPLEGVALPGEAVGQLRQFLGRQLGVVDRLGEAVEEAITEGVDGRAGCGLRAAGDGGRLTR